MRNAIKKAIPMLALLLLSVLFVLAGCQEQEPPQDSATVAVSTPVNAATPDVAAAKATADVPDGSKTKVGDAECEGECDGECDGSCESGDAAADGGCEDEVVDCAKEAAGAAAPGDVPAGCERVTFAVEGMTCAGKAGYVNKTLGALEGVAGCYADEGAMTAVVDYDPALWDAGKLATKLSEESEGFFTMTVAE